MKKMNEIEKYFKARIQEIKSLAVRGDVWVFICCAVFLEYLAKLVYGEDKKAKGYKNFIKNYLSVIDVRYNNFSFSKLNCDGLKKNLPDQMYHILRCGIVHSFSLYPDKISKNNGGAKQSIVLGHEINGDRHLTPYIKNNFDSVIFTTEGFSSDIEKLVDKIFTDAKTYTELAKRILKWYSE